MEQIISNTDTKSIIVYNVSIIDKYLCITLCLNNFLFSDYEYILIFDSVFLVVKSIKTEKNNMH